jgi:hypothetical protein
VQLFFVFIRVIRGFFFYVSSNETNECRTFSKCRNTSLAHVPRLLRLCGFYSSRTNIRRSFTNRRARPCFPRFPWLSAKAGGRPDFVVKIPRAPANLPQTYAAHSPITAQNFFDLVVKIPPLSTTPSFRKHTPAPSSTTVSIRAFRPFRGYPLRL